MPDAPPEKWINKGFNTCRIGLDCGGLSDVKINNIPTRETLKVVITKHENHY
ncbi:Imm50 family immunity protein [Pseudomonas sp. DWR1-3-2b2]|uniref:Imm50 family immunity protein n=1 Tax=Pseudomonas sp. DWR1-3-2b2 TaxID=2804671 RepID=UPI003CF88292